MAKRMKYIAALFVIISMQAFGSSPPLSGTFSNVISEETHGHTPSLELHMNLLVTSNESGQQFIVQCFSSGEAGLGVVTSFIRAQVKAEVAAGEHCPSRTAIVELDYNGAIISFQTGWVYLPRGTVYVPAI